jgi:single-strand DNA-binding protein
MNNWSITGRLGHEPRLRAINNGDPVLNLSVAVDRRVKKDGQWVNETMWVDVTMFGKRGESLSKLLAKGKRVAACGELNLREYTGRDGVVKHQLEMIARDVEPLEFADKTGAATNGGAGTHRDDFRGTGRRQQQAYGQYAPPEDDDIPF